MSKPKDKSNSASKPEAALAPVETPVPAVEPSEAPAATDSAPAAPVEISVPAVEPSEAPSPASFTHRIASTPEKGFYRAGRHWPREGVEVTREDFTDEQWKSLTSEPRLVVTPL